MIRRLRLASMKEKMIFGFSMLFVLSLLLIYRGLYVNTVDAMRKKTEDSIMTVAKQTAQQIDKSFDQMATMSHIFTANRRNRELLQLDGLSDIEQIRNYWLLEESLNTLSSYYSDYYVAIFIRQDTLIAKDKVRFFGDEPSFESQLYDEVLMEKGGLYWTTDSRVIDFNNNAFPAISAYRLITSPLSDSQDNQFFRTSIAFQSLEDIFVSSTKSLPITYYILDDDKDVVLASRNEQADIRSLIDGKTSTVKYRNETYFIRYDLIPSNDWTLATLVPDSYFSEATYSTQIFFIVLCLLLFFAFLLVMLVIWRSFDVRVNRIIQLLNDVEQEDYSQQLTIVHKDELSRIEVKVNEFIQRIQYLMKNIVRVEEEKKKSELISLQSQIKPHFLYNTLDSINWMALAKGHYEISSAIVDLANFIRKSLSTSEDYVLVRDELEHIRLYTNIMSERSEYKIRLEEDVCEELLDREAIKFLFQPIVENAIIHGFSMSYRTTGTIVIRGRIEDDMAIFHIIDDGDGFDNENGRKDHFGYGLRNVEYRLKLFYGDSSDLQLVSRVRKGTAVKLTWPLK